MSEKQKVTVGEEGIYDARQLGLPKMLLLGFQHMFAMFGATVLVPLLTGLDVATTLLMAGLGTLLFHFITKGKVPAFLGSSFAFLGGYAAVAPIVDDVPNKELLPYACLGVAAAGLVYQGCRRCKGNAFLPTCCYRTNHHFHRSWTFRLCS